MRVGGPSAGLQHKHRWINLAEEMHSHPGERNVRADVFNGASDESPKTEERETDPNADAIVVLVFSLQK